ncbi:trehalose-phosphatase [Pseudonocardia acidicola]|uniref:Trehalose 6-phosphate phosphatase n=1 Tax=Pseudonocardia acidicola TaxID=2724939 RepID=A0ABX1SCB3_9PSEU|nr:trehalose-phosphatase [Pseudonocardia acidicola]
MTDPLDAGLDIALTELAAAPRLLVTLDFDGVLAPIVSDPAAARPLPGATRAINALTGLPGTTVALVSGRGLADLAAVSGFGAPVRMVGSHGGEFSGGDGGSLLDDEQQALKDELAVALRGLVDGAAGVALEHKPAGVAVHVRNADPATGARVLDAVRSGPASWPGIEPTEGKAVIDLAVLQVSKGAAIDVLRERVGADVVLFAGDDVTDETGFARLGPGDVGIKVGDGETAAGHRVAGPEEMVAVLERLLTLRGAG